MHYIAIANKWLWALLATLWAGCVSAQSFVPVYATRGSPEFQGFNRILKEQRFLETMAQAASETFEVPKLVAITVGECNRVNAFYRKFQDGRGQVVLCYELIKQIHAQHALAVSRGAKLPPGTDGGALSFIFLHEIGHALIDQLRMPFLGREEDAADAVATYVFLNAPNFGDTWLHGALWYFNKKSLFYTRSQFSDEHSLDPQRQATIACFAFGKDPQRYAALVGRERVLSPERAKRCHGEYQKLDEVLRQHLGPRFKPEAMARGATHVGTSSGGGFAPTSRVEGQSCNSNSDCAGSLRCERSVCAAEEVERASAFFRPASRLVGQSCNSNSDCAGDARCESAVCKAAD